MKCHKILIVLLTNVFNFLKVQIGKEFLLNNGDVENLDVKVLLGRDEVCDIVLSL